MNYKWKFKKLNPKTFPLKRLVRCKVTRTSNGQSFNFQDGFLKMKFKDFQVSISIGNTTVQ